MRVTSPDSPRRATAGQLGAWLATRLATLVLLVLPLENGVVEGLSVFHGWSEQVWCHGLLLGRDVPWEYPPGALPFAAPPFGCTSPTTFLTAFVLGVLCLDLATVLVLATLPRGRAASWTWVAVVPLLGPLVLTRFDVALCLLLTLAFAAGRSRPRTSGALLAAAASVKLWPVVLLLVIPRGQARRVRVGAAVAVVALAVIFATTGTWHAFSSAWSYQQHRGLQAESVPALPFMWLNAAGIGGVEFRYGSWQLTTPGASVVAAASDIVLALAVLAVLAAVLLGRGASSWSESGMLSAGLGLTLTVTNKVLSPQYLLWVIVLLAVATGLGPPLRRSWIVMLSASALLTGVLYPPLYQELLDGAVVPTLVLTVRDLLLVALTVLLVRAAYRRNVPDSGPQVTPIPAAVTA
jgi:hypothetical protein